MRLPVYPRKLVSLYDRHSQSRGDLGFVDHTYINWYGCRETFHSHAKSKKVIFFYTRQYASIISIVKSLEKFLKVPKSRRAKFLSSRTRPKFLVIELRWWNKNEVRRQLFTILLRVGLWDGDEGGDGRCSDRENLRKVKTCQYLRGCETSFTAFLNGQTNQKSYGFPGWSYLRHPYHHYDDVLK